MQVYRYYEDSRPFTEILEATPRNPDGGTLAVYLGISALKSGYRATLYPFDLRVFDPSWFDLGVRDLCDKLRARKECSSKVRLRTSIEAWIQFLEAGGKVQFGELSPELLVEILDRGHPILSGLSATWLYRQTRERPDDNEADDLRGDPAGHFVVVCGYSAGGKRFMVRDPSSHVPFSRNGRYVVPAQRLINAILLGDVTQDAVLLELSPERGRKRR